MSKDWYETGMSKMFDEATAYLEACDCKTEKEKVYAVYAFLNDIGIIDYDIEKEILYDRYFEDE